MALTTSMVTPMVVMTTLVVVMIGVTATVMTSVVVEDLLTGNRARWLCVT